MKPFSEGSGKSKGLDIDTDNYVGGSEIQPHSKTTGWAFMSTTWGVRAIVITAKQALLALETTCF